MSKPGKFTRRSEHTRNSLLYVGLIFIVLFLLFATIFGVWWLLMPKTIDMKSQQELTNHQEIVAQQIEADVRHLAENIGERNMHTTGTMDQTVRFLTERLRGIGYSPKLQSYTLNRGIYAGESAENIEVEITGNKHPEKVVVIGAHYDTVPGSPGANDNGSGVAVLMALAEAFVNADPPHKTVRFLFFANEEPPFFQTEDMGSYAYAKMARERGDDIETMIALDGLGYYSSEPNSQAYPLPGLGFFYPKEASFIGLVTRLGDLSLLRSVSGNFEQSGDFPTASAALPGFIPGVNWSDHWSFWQHDYPGLLITDTLLFRDPHYHTPNDTPERLDYEMMARLTSTLTDVVEELAQ